MELWLSSGKYIIALIFEIHYVLGQLICSQDVFVLDGVLSSTDSVVTKYSYDCGLVHMIMQYTGFII